MLTPKRPRAALESTKSKLSKYSSSSAASAKSSGLAEGSATRFVPTPSAAVMSMPVIVVFSVLTAIGYWRQVSPVSAAAKSFVDIRTVEPGTTYPRSSSSCVLLALRPNEPGASTRRARHSTLCLTSTELLVEASFLACVNVNSHLQGEKEII
jgi:hypothetical protein